MSNRANEDPTSALAQQGEFHASKPRTVPETTKGHQPGQLVSEADKAPEFHAQTLPAGTAPPESTFQPNSSADVPAVTSETSQSEAGTSTSASDTLTGSTSGDLHDGLGHPGSGQSSSELRDNSKKSGGLQGVGAEHATSSDQDPNKKLDLQSPVPGATQKGDGLDLKQGDNEAS